MAVAKHLRVILETQNVAAFVKTSGKSGLRVLAPWEQAGGYDEAREWALYIARQVITELPDSATVERRKNRRQKKVYVDVMQNALRSSRGSSLRPPSGSAGDGLDSFGMARTQATIAPATVYIAGDFPAAR